MTSVGGSTPSSGKKFAVIVETSTRSVSPPSPDQRADGADHLRAGAGGKQLERLAALLVVPEVTWRHRGQGLCADPEVHPEVRDTLGRSVWQGPQQHAVHHGEDRRRRAYAEAQRDDGYRRETRTSNQRPQRVSNILANSRHVTLIADSADEGWDE